MRPEVQAIDRVLNAEREGESQLDQERQSARERIDRAREEARRILRRARERIRRVHAHCATSLEARRKELEAEAENQFSDNPQAFIDPAQLQNAVRLLAERLTTADRPKDDPVPRSDTDG